ncbi:Zn-ribbon domain-containing OB-fold protein [Stakelama tenebrarum]|uniref:DNA-binding protein n=1 Tax=Stakelama tenebrarum TaxID=2711215 RepID=A0A6G6Y7G3_9SPHN|nr:OB-fold domain-containing protein [Sphingosinithalassobacter tenebrarum]QIG80737.1 DNA-binding protein [Sphingosinithalassobacter tenebrarum]
MANRPLPKLDAVNRDFWTGGEQGELRIYHCGDCGTWVHPPRPVCRNCLSENVAPEAVPGTATVDTFTINHQPFMRDMEVPFVIARVALDGAPGVFLTTNIVNCPVEDVNIGDKVKVTFLQEEDVWLPLFEKIGEDA